MFLTGATQRCNSLKMKVVPLNHNYAFVILDVSVAELVFNSLVTCDGLSSLRQPP